MYKSVPNANDFIEVQLDHFLAEIENELHADALTFNGPLVGTVDNFVRIAVEQMRSRPKSRDKLVVILGTYGGYY